MTEVVEKCTLCESLQFTRVPSMPAYIQKLKQSKEKKVGSLVEEYIEKNRKSVQDEKKKLKNQEYKE